MAQHKVTTVADGVECSCGWSAPVNDAQGVEAAAHLDDVRRRREQAEARLRESVDDPDVRVEL